MTKRPNRGAWGLIGALVVVLASLALGGIVGACLGHQMGAPYDHSPDSFDVLRESGDEIYGAVAGLLVGLLLGLAWSFVIVTGLRREPGE